MVPADPDGRKWINDPGELTDADFESDRVTTNLRGSIPVPKLTLARPSREGKRSRTSEQVVLRAERASRDSRHLSAYLDALGNPHVDGHACVEAQRSGKVVRSLRDSFLYSTATPDHPGPYDAGMRLCDVLGLRWSLTHGVLEENGGTRSLNRNLLARMALPAAAMLLALFQV